MLEHSVERLTQLFNHMIAEGKISNDSMMVFVNDGSKDRTWEIIEQQHAENRFVKGINLSRNVGHQNAIMAGMMTARKWADAVVTIDADLQDDLGALEKMVDECNAGYDIVYGVKVSRKADPLMKRLSAEAFYKFRLMSRRALDMLAGYHERNLYLRGLVPMVGLKSTTVDDVISEREAGESKYTLKKMLNLAMDGITSFSVKPIYIILYMGILFMVVTLMIALYVVRALILGTAVSGWASLILSIWFVGGFILIALGIVGLYIGKIYTEVKGRPLYNIQEVLE